MASPVQTSTSRLAFLDWTRGAAALIMLHGHAYHAFADKEAHESSAYVLSQFVGGMSAAIFLFLTGVTLAFLMSSRERRGVNPAGRIVAAMRRSAYLFAIAILFRLELFVSGLPNNHWTDLFRVDILNSMGLAILLFSPLAALSTEQRVRWGAMLGAAVAGTAPLVSALNLSALHPFLRAYVVPDYNSFGFFPWASFVGFGISAGSLIRLAGSAHLPRLMQWSALAGLALITGGRFFADLPYSLYANSEFWLNSPMLIFIKLGVILLGLAFAFLWTTHGSRQRWSFVQQLGTTSLLVYWVHIEVVYGRWFGAYKETLSVEQCAASAVLLIGVMVGLSLLRTRWQSLRAWFATQTYRPPLAPERVAGD